MEATLKCKRTYTTLTIAYLHDNIRLFDSMNAYSR
jgi:hypothetical protein